MNSFDQFVGKRVMVEKVDGHKFTSRIYGVDSEWITFESRDGRLSRDRISSISRISELVEE